MCMLSLLICSVQNSQHPLHFSLDLYRFLFIQSGPSRELCAYHMILRPTSWISNFSVWCINLYFSLLKVVYRIRIDGLRRDGAACCTGCKALGDKCVILWLWFPNLTKWPTITFKVLKINILRYLLNTQKFSSSAVWVWLDQILWITTKQPTKFDHILSQMLLNPDWCEEVCDVGFLQLSPVDFKPVRRAQKPSPISTDIFHVKNTKLL